jgi:hypothetical protein
MSRDDVLWVLGGGIVMALGLFLVFSFLGAFSIPDPGILLLQLFR